jgi:uncharacterized protein (DUF1501 family)
VALVSIGTTAGSFLKGAVAFAAQHPGDVVPGMGGKTLILVQMAGGNDGLSTLAPYRNGAYQSARLTLALGEEEVLQLDDEFGLHPNLVGLKGLWDDGKLAVIQGVGYPEQNYSHFKSMAIWQRADPELALTDGWLGRTLDAMESETHDPFLGFNVGGSTPISLQGPVQVPSVANPADYAFKVAGEAAGVEHQRTATLLKLYEEYPSTSPFGVLLETTLDTAVESSAALAEAGQLYTPAVEYPDTSFGSGLSLLAQAVVGELGMRVGHVTIGGFDTHTNQRAAHDDLMATLDGGLSAFYSDLEAHGKAEDVIVLTWSEFARRVEENANEGTDHGAANLMFAIGRGVQGGMYGEPPSLEHLVDRGNLGYTTDFRSVYATVAERWLGVQSQDLLGEQWPVLDFLG